MRYNKSKLNAIRFFLAQTDGDGLEVRKKIMRMREFRTEAAQNIFNNPFLTGDREIYVLGRICAWADVVLPKDWELYATFNGVKELAKAIRKEPYAKPEDKTYTERRIMLQQCKNTFFSINNDKEAN